jgi:RNA polymerase sigma-70 factor (ECF subfamily)
LTSWETIVQEHGQMAFAAAWRVLGHASDAEDAVQEALLDAFHLHRSQSVASWGALLRRLATCRALDLLRKRRPAERLSATSAVSASADPPAVAVARELAQRLREALPRLAPREAEVFSLRYFGELTNDEIADELELTTGAVGVALHKARTRLRELLETEEDAK